MRVATSSSSWRNLVAPGEIVTSSDLNERFAHGQEPEGLIRYSAHNNLAMAIANNHGVARAFEVASSPDGGWYAQKAPDSEVADSIAGHNLSIAADFEVSLERLWGKTGTREGAMRSPEVRLRIFEVLSGLKPKQPIDLEILAQRAGLKAGRCQQHIQMLHQFGLVEYEASNLHNQAVFEITGDPNPESRPGIKRYGRVMPRPLDYGGDPKLRTQVGYILLGFQEEGRENFTYSDVIPKLEHPDKINMGHIAGIMGDLLREGILKRLHKSPFSNDAFSNIGVDDTQRALMQRITRVFRGLEDGDPRVIQEGIEAGEDILADKPLTTALLMRGKTFSPAANRRWYSEQITGIKQLLSGAELSTREIQRLHDEGRLTLDGMYTLLARMRGKGEVESKKRGNEQLWRLAGRVTIKNELP